jgi:hypothetical protein
MSACNPIVLKNSAFQEGAKFPSDPYLPLGILILRSPPQESIRSIQRKKIGLAEFFNTIRPIAGVRELASNPVSGHSVALASGPDGAGVNGCQEASATLDFSPPDNHL